MSTDEEDIERRADAVIRELDEFCALALNPSTKDLIFDQRIAFGQMHTRIAVIVSYLISQKPKW